MSYFLSPALAQLRDQINAQYGHRDKTSDGWIGDASHQARPSDHNPDYSDGGIVRAIDVDEDLVIGMTAVGEAMPLAEAILRDSRTRYVIYEGRLAYGAHVTGVPRGWQPYTGPNAHRHHIHVSARRGARYDRDDRAWALPGAPTPTPTGGFMADLTEQEKKDFLADIADIRSAVLAPIKDGDGAAPPRVIAERTLNVARRVLAHQLVDDAVPVEVDVELDAEAVHALADALLERLPKETAEAVLAAMHARLAK